MRKQREPSVETTCGSAIVRYTALLTGQGLKTMAAHVSTLSRGMAFAYEDKLGV
jgi:hypothetical protein